MTVGTKAPTIEIALATYNSERFLAELLDSLFAQTRQDFRILVGDDGSSDSTLDILGGYSACHPGRIGILPQAERRLGVRANFGRLLSEARADYLLLCDHDDVWLPEKVAVSVEAIGALEARHPAGTPLLVHTDLTVVGAALELLGDSFFDYSGIDPARSDLVSLLLVNVATGCATILNRALYERARPVPREAIMYDHWLALVAAATGAIDFVGRPTILYRQHGGNAIGAKRAGTRSLLQRVKGTLFSDERERVISAYSRQASALLDRFGGEMRPMEREAATALGHIWSIPRWRRYRRLRGSGLGLRGLVRNIALFIVLARSRGGADSGRP